MRSLQWYKRGAAYKYTDNEDEQHLRLDWKEK